MFRRAAFAWTVTGVLLLLAACGTSGDTTGSASPSTNATSSSTPVATVQPTVSLEDVGWEMVGGGPLPKGTPLQVAVSGSAIVIIATSDDPLAGPTTFWSSANGGTWTRGTVDGAAGGWFRDVAGYPDGFVAVGDDGCPFGVPIALEGCTPVIWQSADGSTWTRISLKEPADSRLTAVTVWHNELVAVGARLTDPATEAATPMILRSPDGLAWEAMDPAAAKAGFLTDVATDGEQLVAVGIEDAETGPSIAIAWTSRDGGTWTREVIGETQLFPVMVAPMPGGFVATCQGTHTSARQEPIGWLRSATWTALPMPDVRLDAVTAIAGGPQGAVIVGSDIMIDYGMRPPLLYATQDGDAWAFVPPLGAASSGGFIPFAVIWDAGRFYLAGMEMSTGARRVLAGMAYVPRADELPYSPPVPSVTPRPGSSEPAGRR